MGSNVSTNKTTSSSNSIRSSTCSKSDSILKNDLNGNEKNSHCQSIQSPAYIKDKFRLEFLDCDCCCDTTKKLPDCDFQGINVLRDLYDLVVAPEYKMNCRCSCGDNTGEPKQMIKFGLTGSPNIQLTTPNDGPCSTPSDSEGKK
ncbi:unnamed protein product [Rotaria magnacalcarata]|uniref:Uncharacterized protein n=3 Tax=Rotaria magnacalcarata TaxID=392030 RepID=A0A816RI77_9BILA|nr:unnamed protein product [Rotaria magnacalcarata]CAF1550479.1 unnamed protein product [Rotaria magnacalcarata]CAF1930683.1 unnamed protein product [Rotaria magnacalcarata]CAF2073821.1 unnamed protein product [Rotaria magnacalcarata]CAF3810907.1 unnamed protein product [Rotaria magnacalcarata]